METQIQIKMEQKDKDIIIEACSLLGSPYSVFMRITALKEARRILKEMGDNS